MAPSATLATRSLRGGAREKLVAAALASIRAKGYAATSVDDICRAAGVTKGAFFHHFRTKDDLAVAAANAWSEQAGERFAASPHQAVADPLARIFAYLDYRKALLKGPVADFTCPVGTMVQEAYAQPDIRAACDAMLDRNAARLEDDIAAVMFDRGVKGDWTAASLALHVQAVLQGAFILAKAKGSGDVAADSLDHLKRYVALLFGESG